MEWKNQELPALQPDVSLAKWLSLPVFVLPWDNQPAAASALRKAELLPTPGTHPRARMALSGDIQM